MIRKIALSTLASFPCKECDLTTWPQGELYAQVVTEEHARNVSFSPLKEAGIGEWTRTGVYYIVRRLGKGKQLTREEVDKAIKIDLARHANVHFENIRYEGRLE